MRICGCIFLDHHATTPVDPKVLDKMLPYFTDSFGNPHSADHAFGWTAMQAIDVAANQIARLLGGDPDEIIFTSGATEANNLAILGSARGSHDEYRRRVLIAATDHKSALASAHSLAADGFSVELLEVDAQGSIEQRTLEKMVADDVLVLSFALVNSEVGTVQNLQAISDVARRAGVLLHCDASQAPCAMDLGNAAALADMISLSAHKMYGPKGVGALFVNRAIQSQIHPLIHGGGQQNGVRSGTLPTALCVGFGAAAELLLSREALDERARIAALRDELVEGLRALPWRAELNNASMERHPGNANIRFDGFAAADILAALQPKLAASTGSACTSGMPEPSYVLRELGLTHDQALSSIRFCVGRFTTKEDVQDAVKMIAGVLDRLDASGARTAAA